MKKFIALILFAVLIIFTVYKNKEYFPYAGSYQYTKNPSLVLRLNLDNSCMIYNAEGKKGDFIKGKYMIEDNSIKITPNKDNLNKFITETLHGKIEGSKISIFELNSDFIKY